MNVTQENCQTSPTVDWEDESIWETAESVYESIYERKKLLSGETIPAQESSSLSDSREDSAKRELWGDLEKIWPFLVFGSLAPIFRAYEQTEDDEWIDSAAVMPKRIGTRKGRIKGRSKIMHVGMEHEIQDEDDEWIDTAAVMPKRVGTRKGRIKKRRQLKPTTLPGDFADQD